MPVVSQFELEPVILQTIKDLSLEGLANVIDETQIAGVTNLAGLLPACIVFTGPGYYSPGADGRLQTETQLWQIVIVVKHIRATGSATTASEAGKYLTPILQALIGKQLTANFRPLEVVDRSQPIYETGMASFPVTLQTSFDVKGA